MISLQCKDGDFLHVVLDENIKSNVLEIRSQNVSACLITTPEKPKGSLAIQLPFFTMLVKNLDSFFTAEVTVSLTVLLNSRGFGDHRLTPNEATMCVQVTVALKIDRCLESDSSFALKIRVLISIMSLIILLWMIYFTCMYPPFFHINLTVNPQQFARLFTQLAYHSLIIKSEILRVELKTFSIQFTRQNLKTYLVNI